MSCSFVCVTPSAPSARCCRSFGSTPAWGGATQPSSLTCVPTTALCPGPLWTTRPPLARPTQRCTACPCCGADSRRRGMLLRLLFTERSGTTCTRPPRPGSTPCRGSLSVRRSPRPFPTVRIATLGWAAIVARGLLSRVSPPIGGAEADVQRNGIRNYSACGR
jgi:hypothetical protein